MIPFIFFILFSPVMASGDEAREGGGGSHLLMGIFLSQNNDPSRSIISP